MKRLTEETLSTLPEQRKKLVDQINAFQQVFGVHLSSQENAELEKFQILFQGDDIPNEIILENIIQFDLLFYKLTNYDKIKFYSSIPLSKQEITKSIQDVIDAANLVALNIATSEESHRISPTASTIKEGKDERDLIKAELDALKQLQKAFKSKSKGDAKKNKELAKCAANLAAIKSIQARMPHRHFERLEAEKAKLKSNLIEVFEMANRAEFGSKFMDMAQQFLIDPDSATASENNTFAKVAAELERRQFLNEVIALGNTKITKYLNQNSPGFICIVKLSPIYHEFYAKMQELAPDLKAFDFIDQNSQSIAFEQQEGEQDIVVVEFCSYYSHGNALNFRKNIMRQQPGNLTSVYDMANDFVQQQINMMQELEKIGLFYFDFKPENFLVNEEGNLIIQDRKSFLQSDQIQTREDWGQKTAATKDYSYLFAPGNTDTDFDLDKYKSYALGANLYSFLTGEAPTAGFDFENEVFKTEVGAQYSDLIQKLTSCEMTIDDAKVLLHEIEQMHDPDTSFSCTSSHTA